MVVHEFDYQCGCGYRTPLLSEADEHVRKTGHKMTVNGKIGFVGTPPKSR